MYLRRSQRAAIAIAVVLALAAGVYAWRGAALVDDAADAASALVKKASVPPPPTEQEQQRSQARRSGQARDGQAAPAPPVHPRKCVQNGKTIYTDEPCPAGSEEQIVPENLSVVPGSR